MYLKMHGLIYMLSIKYEIGDEKLSEESQLCHKEWRTLPKSYRREIRTLGKSWPYRTPGKRSQDLGSTRKFKETTVTSEATKNS